MFFFSLFPADYSFSVFWRIYFVYPWLLFLYHCNASKCTHEHLTCLHQLCTISRKMFTQVVYSVYERERKKEANKDHVDVSSIHQTTDSTWLHAIICVTMNRGRKRRDRGDYNVYKLIEVKEKKSFTGESDEWSMWDTNNRCPPTAPKGVDM